MSYQFDHRQLADEMEIFFFNDEIGAGLPVWLPNGVAIRDQLERFIIELERRSGYQRVVSPHLGRQELYEKSGHLECFAECMFPPIHWPEENKNYFLKPMNCPHHHKVFASMPRSYRQLPLRIAEYGQVYRYELSGALRGLSRVRGLCQNDAHIYLDPKDVLKEVHSVLDLHEACYSKLGLKNYRYRLSLRDPKLPNIFQGDSSDWNHAENILREALKSRGLNFFEAIGEAAFYGPKIDIQMKMSSEQEESISSIQIDFLSAHRFDLSFASSDGGRIRPWIIHRAPLGSHERFIAMLLEFFDGQMPGWLAPVQLLIIPVSDNEWDYCLQLQDYFLNGGVRVKLVDQQGSLSKKLFFGHRLRPYAKLIVGQKELQSQSFNLEMREGIGNSKNGSKDELSKYLLENCKIPI